MKASVPRKRFTSDWKPFLPLFGWLAILILVVGFVRWKWFGASIGYLIYEATFTALLVTVGILRTMYPAFRTITTKGFIYYWKFTATLVLALGPISLFYLLSKLMLGESGAVMQIITMFLSVMIWLTLVSVISVEQWRVWAFEHIRRLGWLSPFIFLINFALTSVILFSTYSFSHL